MVSYYDFKDLLFKAVNSDSHSDRMALGEWFDLFGSQFFNGEYYDCSFRDEDGVIQYSDLGLFPISEPISFYDDGEPFQWEVIDFVFRRI